MVIILMRKLVLLLLFLYASSAVAVENNLLNTVLLTSDKKKYDAPKLTIIEFKELVDKVALCEAQTVSEFVEVGENLLQIQYRNIDSIWGEGGISKFTISYLKHDGEYLAYLQTHDLGPTHIWDENRFIPSSEMVDILRIAAKACEQ